MKSRTYTNEAFLFMVVIYLTVIFLTYLICIGV
jgi:hypothetical protein